MEPQKNWKIHTTTQSVIFLVPDFPLFFSTVFPFLRSLLELTLSIVCTTCFDFRQHQQNRQQPPPHRNMLFFVALKFLVSCPFLFFFSLCFREYVSFFVYGVHSFTHPSSSSPYPSPRALGFCWPQLPLFPPVLNSLQSFGFAERHICQSYFQPSVGWFGWIILASQCLAADQTEAKKKEKKSGGVGLWPIKS